MRYKKTSISVALLFAVAVVFNQHERQDMFSLTNKDRDVPMLTAIAHDGITLPLPNEYCQNSNQCVTINFNLRDGDTTLPEMMTVYKPLSDFVATGNVASAKVKVDGKICIANNTGWPYVIGRQYMLSGYYSLEVDLLLDDGKTVCMRKRRPEFLCDNGLSIEIVRPHGKWESLISLDGRLWNVSLGNFVSRLFHSVSLRDF